MERKETDAKSIEEPFEGYNNYIKRLKQHLGKEVCLQEGFDIMGYGKKRLLKLERSNNLCNRLFPHKVSFDDDSTINLSNIASITESDAYQFNINPEEKSTLYLNIPEQKEYKEFLETQLKHMGRDFKRYA